MMVNNIDWGINMKIYDKLVRDKIPDLIESDGKKCVTHILSEKEYIAALEAKLDEEVAEYQADKNLEEMAVVVVGTSDNLHCKRVYIRGIGTVESKEGC